MIDPKELALRFADPTPSDEQQHIIARVFASAKVLADLVNVHCPDGREKTLSLRYMEDAAGWARKAVLTRPPPSAPEGDDTEGPV